MLSDKQLKEALAAEAEEAAVPADLIREKVRRSGGRLMLRPGLWHKLQIGQRLEVVAVFFVLLALIFGAMRLNEGPDEAFPGDPLIRTEASVERILVTGFTGFPPENGEPEPLTHPRDTAVMAKIWGWARAARVIGPDPADKVPGRIRRPVLVIEVKDGRSVRYSRAYDCVSTGNGTQCTAAQDQVTAWWEDEAEGVRLRAPELAAWLDGGWEKDLRPARVNFQAQVEYGHVVRAQVHSLSPDRQEVALHPKDHAYLLRPLISGWNNAERLWSRDAGTTPSFTVDVIFDSGSKLTLHYVESLDFIMASYNSEGAIWVESDQLKEALKAVGEAVYR